MQSFKQFMQQALDLAAQGEGCTSPNPLVGCVLVHQDTVIGQGWHAHYGHAHAEVNAIEQVRAQGKTIPAGTTLVVTLEPCNHHGLTRPCTQAILDAGIKRVVYSLDDPNPKAAGGAEFLRSQGVEVSGGLLQEKARFQNRFFLKHVDTRLPFLIAKSAHSIDGRIATRTGHSQWITGPEARRRAHQLRQSVDAIIVGADTVISDDPALTVRLPDELCPPERISHPRPVILDSRGRVPQTARVLSELQEDRRPIVATTHRMPQAHRQDLESRGVDVVALPQAPSGGVDPLALLQMLGERAIQSAMLEGGAKVNGSFRDAGLIDEVWSFVAPVLIGGKDAPAVYAAQGSETLDDATYLHDINLEMVGKDLLIRGLVRPLPASGRKTYSTESSGRE